MSGNRAVVRRLAHRRGANFSLGFRLLPPGKRRAVYAAYAACRIPDDIVDEGAAAVGSDVTRRRLDEWADEIERTYRGSPGTPETRALAEVLGLYPIPKRALLGLVDGCRMDLERGRYATFSELERYCELVAVTISDISLAIFGTLAPGASALGRHLAMALQLTNICRDVGEDVRRDRIYLPLDELARFGVREEDLLGGRVDTEGYAALLAFECERARVHFRDANPLPRLLEPDSRPAVRVMGGVYRRVLDGVRRDPRRAFRTRVELAPWQRFASVAAGLLGRPFV
ncbi:MAG TPA: squalene/phytoene synthase family protein [Thermoanaerobaculaceae bacterium]|nr:squalene/phytoene synthase family protein [Thermoanaerobaculaceae bacterium]